MSVAARWRAASQAASGQAEREQRNHERVGPSARARGVCASRQARVARRVLLPACDEDCLRQAARACEGLRRWLLEICARSQLFAAPSVLVTPLLLPQSHNSHPRLNRWSWALLPRSACSPVSASSVRRRSLPSPACLESLLSPYVCLVHSSSCALPPCPRVPACLMRSFWSPLSCSRQPCRSSILLRLFASLACQHGLSYHF